MFFFRKPVIGFNSDPSRSEGRLCLPKWCSQDLKEALQAIANVIFIKNHKKTISGITLYVFCVLRVNLIGYIEVVFAQHLPVMNVFVRVFQTFLLIYTNRSYQGFFLLYYISVINT